MTFVDEGWRREEEEGEGGGRMKDRDKRMELENREGGGGRKGGLYIGPGLPGRGRMYASGGRGHCL